MSQTTTTTDTALVIKEAVESILGSIEQEREREIISRRFGLFERRETLEQIGEMLGITRERVRQLEKAILIRLKIQASDDQMPALNDIEKLIIRDLSENGRVGKVQDIARRLTGEKLPSLQTRSHIAFVSELSPKLTAINENDNYFQGVGLAEKGDEKKFRSDVDKVVSTIKKNGEPIDIESLHAKLDFENPAQVRAIASLSKALASLKDTWGLSKWPTVNPKNIRDKIYVILSENTKPLHFSDIAKSIKSSDFKRKDVTTQAIHNELIKDKRFVLIGRGVYALEEWGYSRGTVSEVIARVLKKSGEPMHRDEIVRQVLKKRQVKETTVLLNLQSKPEFKRVAKATYVLADSKK